MATLYMSGYDEDRIVKHGKLVPGARLLAKPFSPEQLTAAVNEALKAGASADKRDHGKPYPQREETALSAPVRILVIDDEPGIAEIIADVLRDKENKVIAAEDGSSAITIASEFKPDVVLLDIKLPDMDGYEASRRIRELSIGSDPFIIAASGYSAEESAADAFDAYITKPVDFARLKELIARRRADNTERPL